MLRKEEREELRPKIIHQKTEEIKPYIYQGIERGVLQDFQYSSPKSLIKHEDGKNSYATSQGSSGNDSISSSKRGLILKHKLMQLSDKYRKQKIQLVENL